MTAHYRAIVHGRTLELLSDPGLPDGQEVRVSLTVISADKSPIRGWQRLEGILANDEEWDRIMEQIRQDRKLERRYQFEAWDDDSPD